MPQSEVVVRVHLLVEGVHFLADADTEVFDAHVFALEERRQELLRDTLSVLDVQLAQLVSIVGRRELVVFSPLKHYGTFLIIKLKALISKKFTSRLCPFHAPSHANSSS